MVGLHLRIVDAQDEKVHSTPERERPLDKMVGLHLRIVDAHDESVASQSHLEIPLAEIVAMHGKQPG